MRHQVGEVEECCPLLLLNKGGDVIEYFKQRMQLAKLEKEVKGNSKDIENIFMVLKELIENQAS